MNINTLWDGADKGAAQFTQKYPDKEILNISPAMGSHLLRYRIIDKTILTNRVPVWGMGGDYIIYNPHSQQLTAPQSGKVTATPLRTTMHIIHELHTRLALKPPWLISHWHYFLYLRYCCCKRRFPIWAVFKSSSPT